MLYERRSCRVAFPPSPVLLQLEAPQCAVGKIPSFWRRRSSSSRGRALPASGDSVSTALSLVVCECRSTSTASMALHLVCRFRCTRLCSAGSLPLLKVVLSMIIESTFIAAHSEFRSEAILPELVVRMEVEVGVVVVVPPRGACLPLRS